MKVFGNLIHLEPNFYICLCMYVCVKCFVFSFVFYATSSLDKIFYNFACPSSATILSFWLRSCIRIRIWNLLLVLLGDFNGFFSRY